MCIACLAFFELTLLFSVSPSHLAPYFVTSKICCPAWGVTMQRSSHAVAAALRGMAVKKTDEVSRCMVWRDGGGTPARWESDARLAG